MSVTRDSGSSSTRMFSSLLDADATRGSVFDTYFLVAAGVVDVRMRVVGVRGYDGRILDADRCEKWRPRCADKQGGSM